MRIEKSNYAKYIQLEGKKETHFSKSIEDQTMDFYLIYEGKEIIDKFYLYKKEDNWLKLTMKRKLLNKEVMEMIFQYLQKFHEYLTVIVAEEDENTLKLVKDLSLKLVGEEIQVGVDKKEYKYFVYRKELKDEYGLVPMEAIKEKVDAYAKEHFYKDIDSLSPIFREEKGKYYFAYMFIDINKPEKRPTKWLLADIITGDIIEAYDSNEYDYADKRVYPIDSPLKTTYKSPIYDSFNYMNLSYFKWKKKIIEELEEKFGMKKAIDINILKTDEEPISSNDFVLANIESLLNDISKDILFPFGDSITTMFNEYHDDVVYLIRKEYAKTGKIDKSLLTNYICLIKYSWPESIDLIDQINNIEYVHDEKFDEALKELTN